MKNYFVPKGFDVQPRGTQKKFPVQLASDGTPCISGPAIRAVSPGTTIHVFTPDGQEPLSFPVDDTTTLYAVRPGDFLGIYTVAANEMMLESYHVDSIHSNHLIATLADTLISIH